MAYRPSEKRTLPRQTQRVSALPVMNLMVVLIPLLLSVAQYVQVSLLEYQPPAGERVQGPRLDLVVNVLPEGLEVSTFGATRGEHYQFLPRRGAEHDLEGLRRELVRIRRDVVGAALDTVQRADPATGRSVRVPRFRFEDARVINIGARGATDWETVVRVMDAAREYRGEEGRLHKLFPLPRLGQIQ